MTDTERKDLGHTSVLLQESIDGLDLHEGDIFLDCTLGNGGHSEEVVRRFDTKVRIIGIDMDADALKRAEKRFRKLDANATFLQGNFRNLEAVLDSIEVEHVTKMIFDLGLSSNQFEESGRGFSFQKDEPLHMTFKKDPTPDDVTAETIVNEWGEDTLQTILWGFGEERYSKKIAKAIVEYRKAKPIKTTSELVEIITNATPNSYHHRKTHPATKTFQALRIAVNDELEALNGGLYKGFERLASGGRMAVISFHSLEDRIVKNFMRDRQKADEGTVLTKKPMIPADEEVAMNRRSRSAKLRILIKK